MKNYNNKIKNSRGELNRNIEEIRESPSLKQRENRSKKRNEQNFRPLSDYNKILNICDIRALKRVES